MLEFSQSPASDYPRLHSSGHAIPEFDDNNNDDDVSPARYQHLLPPVHVAGVHHLSAEELRHLLGGELGLAHVAKVPGEMDGLALHQRGQQSHVTRLPPPGRQREAQTIQFVS